MPLEQGIVGNIAGRQLRFQIGNFRLQSRHLVLCVFHSFFRHADHARFFFLRGIRQFAGFRLCRCLLLFANLRFCFRFLSRRHFQFAQRLQLLRLEEIIDSAKMFFHFPASKLIDFLHKPVEEITVVRHDYRRPVEIFDRLFQHIFRLHVQMVRRLVEYQ